MNIDYSLQLAGNALLAFLDEENEYLPTWGYEAAHDLGRWWDAALRLEAATGFAIPPDIEAASLRNLKRLTDNAAGILMNSSAVPCLRDKAKVNPHNLRETLIAMNALVRYRGSGWARDAGLKLVRTLDRCFQANGKIDWSRVDGSLDAPMTSDPSHLEIVRNGWFDATATSGRCLEALVWFYETTGEALALNVANRIAEHHLAYSTQPDGHIRREIVDPENIGHCHSYLGTMRGLLLFGLLTNQHRFVDIVEATYRNGIRNRMVTESGWAPHDLGKTRFPNSFGDSVTDPASAGDAAQIALWLAIRVGCDDLLDDVERIVRARLIPSQITPGDEARNPARRFTAREMGAWGICNAPHGGKTSTPDVLAAVVHTLCDVRSHSVSRDRVGLRVNLQIDRSTDDVDVTSARDEAAMLQVVVKHHGSLLVHVPAWAPASSVVLTVDDIAVPVVRVGSYCWIARDALLAGSVVRLRYGIPERHSAEAMPSGRRYSFDWRGDEIVGIDPQDSPLPFHPPHGK